jgi:hypothetical protein
VNVLTLWNGPGVGAGVKLVEDVAGHHVVPAPEQVDRVLRGNHSALQWEKVRITARLSRIRTRKKYLQIRNTD